MAESSWRCEPNNVGCRFRHRLRPPLEDFGLVRDDGDVSEAAIPSAQRASGPGSCGIAGSRAADRRTWRSQGLRCLAQMPVDGLGAWHAAGHGADQQRRAHRLAQQLGAQVDLRQVQLGHAQCSKPMYSQPAATVAGAVPRSGTMSRWSSLRRLRAVSLMLAPSVASGAVASDRTDGSVRTPPPPRVQAGARWPPPAASLR